MYQMGKYISCIIHLLYKHIYEQYLVRVSPAPFPESDFQIAKSIDHQIFAQNTKFVLAPDSKGLGISFLEANPPFMK